MAQIANGPVLGIVASRADDASMHVHEQLLAVGEWTAGEDPTRPAADGGGTYHTCPGAVLRTIEERHLDTVDAADCFDAELALLCFVSRHAGETGPLLTAHATGNCGPAEHGGRASELARAAPGAVGAILGVLADAAPEGYDVAMECTHHGPSRVGCPSLFVELGSEEAQWADPDGARAVARGTLAARGVDPRTPRAVAVIGGDHYAPRATRIARETDWGVGHVLADWGLDAIEDPQTLREVIEQAVEHSGATRVLRDTDDEAAVDALGSMDVPVVGETFLRETESVPLATIGAVEDALGRVAEGVRFGDVARSGETAVTGGGAGVADVRVVDLPPALVEAASAVDRADAVAAVAATTVAYETVERGNRLGERIAVQASGTDRDGAVPAEVLEALLEVCEREYEIDRTDGAVTLTRTVFDPALAREAGVPDGPAFGRLASGEPVDIDGLTVHPEDVRRTETTEIPLIAG